EKRNNMSNARPFDSTLTRYDIKSLGSPPGKLASTCHPVSPGSLSDGKRTGKVPRPPRGNHRRFPTRRSKASRSTGVFAASRKGGSEYPPSRTTGRVHVDRSLGSQPVSLHSIFLASSAISREKALSIRTNPS